MSQMPNVFIILVNWNGWKDTVECIQSLQKLEYSNYSIVVVDNDSSDKSVEMINRRTEDVTLLTCNENKGFAGGNNVGIEYALEHDADYIWLLNNDTVVEGQALTPMVKYMRVNPEIGICGSKLIYYHQRDTLQALGGGVYNKWLGITENLAQSQNIDYKFNQSEVEQKLQFIVGASMLVSKDFIEEVGLLNEEYFLYYEEIDWAMRGLKEFRLGFCPDSIIYHKEGSATGGNHLDKSSKSRKSDYYQLKNRLKFTWKYYPECLPTVYLTMIYAMLNRLWRGQWRRIPMIFRLMFNFNK